jgi:uncharacterized membrane protein YphA (DoxX/SURF4 family)
MNKEQVLGLVRHILTFVGGILVAKGIATEAQSVELVGAVITAIGGIWSILSKK